MVDTDSECEYRITLYYKTGAEDADSLAASLAAKAHPDFSPKDFPNVAKVKIPHKLVGYFRPVSCGGSCAPANPRWPEERILFGIQLKFSPDLLQSNQRATITALANSAILAGPRCESGLKGGEQPERSSSTSAKVTLMTDSTQLSASANPYWTLKIST